MISNLDFQAIAELDLEPIKVKLMHKESGEGWSLEMATSVEADYRRFLYLMKMHPNEEAAPLMDVDIFWHYHILDTMKYAADCDKVFGYFKHHFPYIGLRGDDDLEAHHRMGSRMQELYESTFGEAYFRDREPSLRSAQAAPQVAFSAVPPVQVAFSAVPPQQVAFSAVPPQQLAFSAVPPKQLAFSAVPPQQFAFSAVPPKQVAFSAVPPQQVAFSAVPPAQFAFSAVPPKQVAFSAVPPQQVAFSAVPPKQVAFSAVPPAQMAFSAVPPTAIQSKLFSERPRLATA